MNPQPTLNAYIKQALCEFSELSSLTDLQGATYTYSEVAREIARMHIAFEHLGLCPSDRVALCGKNGSHWSMAFLSAMTYGAVAVPILNDFNPESIQHLVDHSESTILFVDENIWKNLNIDTMPRLKAAVRLSDYQVIYTALPKDKEKPLNIDAAMQARYPKGFTPQQLKVYEGNPDDAAVINYTSGSTGNSKGVVLSYRSLWSNIQFCIDGLTFLKPGDGMVCMLPLAHMFGLMIEMVHTFVKGCHIHFITKVPSPRILLQAFALVRPKLIITVPLVLEKIIKTRVLPTLSKPAMRFMLMIPGLNNVIYKKVRRKILDAFGGNVLEIIIGGAGLNKDIEKFLRRIKFPYTVGYGMTECGPLISYCPWDRQRMTSCGLTAPRMEVRVESDDPENTPGVLWVRGDNVMKGYFKNPEATESVFRDGWMNTGDICTVDADGYIYIRGRDKNMILGPSGQNIYPEEIEGVINNLPYVNESIVLDAGGGKLVALIHPDYEATEKDGLDDEAIEKLMRDNVNEANKGMSSYNRVSDIRIQREEFEKTPKKSIKRFLYTA